MTRRRGEGAKGAETKPSADGKKASEGEKPQSAVAPPPPPVEVQPATGKIDLPAKPDGAGAGAKPSGAKPAAGRFDVTAKPGGGKASAVNTSGKSGEKLDDQINQLRQMKQAAGSKPK